MHAGKSTSRRTAPTKPPPALPPPDLSTAAPTPTINVPHLTRLAALMGTDISVAPTYFSLMANERFKDMGALSAYVVEGASNGFKCHFESDPPQGLFNKANYKSALEDADRISTSLQDRISKGRTIGPFLWEGSLPLGYSSLFVNPLGSIPYKYEPWRSRPIDDPIVNEYLWAPYFPMPTLGLIRAFSSPGCWYGLQDVASAFPCLPLHPSMWPYFGFLWNDLRPGAETPSPSLYLHTHGLFGPRDLPYIWTMYMLFVSMAAVHLGIPLVAPYLDDICHVRDRRSEVAFDMHRTSEHLEDCGTPDKVSKRQGPFQKGAILGRLFDSKSFTISVPADKMQRLIASLKRVFSESRNTSGKVTCKDYREFCGYASFVGSVLHKAFQSYLAPIFALLHLTSSRRPHNRIRLSAEAVAAGRALIHDIHRFDRTVSINTDYTHTRTTRVYSDASGAPSLGWGYVSLKSFRAGIFGPPMCDWHIDILELLALLYGVQAHAESWRGCIVPLYCDNEAVVGWVKRGRAKAATLERRLIANSILRELFALSLQYDFLFELTWLASKENEMADALSRGDYARFCTTYAEHKEWH